MIYVKSVITPPPLSRDIPDTVGLGYVLSGYLLTVNWSRVNK